MATHRIALLVLLLAFCCAGCLESEQQYTINPDGTGKVVIEETMPNIERMFAIDDSTRRDKERELREFVVSVVEKSVGVELWKDVSYRSLPDGRIYFKGTAYFRDLNAVKFHALSNTDVTLTPTGDSRVVLAVPEPSVEPEAAGHPPRTDAEIEHAIDSMKAAYGEMREMVLGLEGLREHASYRFAGTIQEAVGFTTDSSGALAIGVDGKKMLRILDSVTSSEGYWRRTAMAAPGSGSDREMVATLFGGAIPRAVIVTGGTPLFDYKAEVKGAQGQYRVLRKKLGVK